MNTLTELIVGLGPVLVVVALFKIFIAPESDLAPGFTFPAARLHWSDLERIRFVARQMVVEGAFWGGWPVASPVLAMAAVATLPAFSRRNAPSESGTHVAVTTAGWLVLVQLLAFFVVYVMTPHSVAWHVQTSWHRLIAQLWPTAVWWAVARSHEGHESTICNVQCQ